jgi:hypothetical protein
MRRKFRVVAGSDSSVFDDLDALREQQLKEKTAPPVSKPSTRRAKIQETFARIPHDRAVKLYRHLGGPEWLLLIEIDRLILKNRGRNPIKLTNQNLAVAGMQPKTKARALRRLQRAGVITVAPYEPGQSPVVTHLWYAIKGD